MQTKFSKILTIFLCLIYIVATIGFVQHTCQTQGVSHVSLFADNSCNHCNAHKHGNHNQCHHDACEYCVEQTDDNCCKTTLEIIEADQNVFQNNISFDNTLSLCAVFCVCETCDLYAFQSVAPNDFIPPLSVPLIYKNGILRL